MLFPQPGMPIRYLLVIILSFIIIVLESNWLLYLKSLKNYPVPGLSSARLGWVLLHVWGLDKCRLVLDGLIWDNWIVFHMVSHSPAGWPRPTHMTEAWFWKRGSTQGLLISRLETSSSLLPPHPVGQCVLQGQPRFKEWRSRFCLLVDELQGHIAEEGVAKNGVKNWGHFCNLLY